MSETKPFIALVDFGSQYTHLIARRLKDLGVDTRFFKPTQPPPKTSRLRGIILSGGPNSVIKNPLPFNKSWLTSTQPLLGLCYGHQLIARQFKGQVTPGQIREYGPARLTINQLHPLTAQIKKHSTVWMSHGDSVTKLPPGFINLGSTATLPHAALAHRSKPIFGLQFHPEVHHTVYGQILLKNFCFNICGLKPHKPTDQLTKIQAAVLQQVGNKKVFLLVSGGVDSTVALIILVKTLGPKRVYALHIDTGLLRQNESRLVGQSLKKLGYRRWQTNKAGALFLKNLAGITDPERKRQIIGQTFLQVAKLATKRLKLNTKDWLLGQGTIYPDTIESGGTKHADKIKTHHNRIGLLQRLAQDNLLVEPLKELYKDEVRRLGQTLGLPQELLWGHPFPGPGLGVRLLCLNKRQANQLNQSVKQLNLKNIPHLILPINSVGVQGDERSYARPLAVDAPYSSFAYWHKQATKLTNQHKLINRVLLKLTGPSLTLIKAYSSFITKQRIKLLQQCDALVTQELKAAGLYYKIWQCPVVLIPIGFRHQESLVIRPFTSREAMTGQAYHLPEPVIKTLAKRLTKLKKLDYIFYDLTDKPPGTVEWE